MRYPMKKLRKEWNAEAAPDPDEAPDPDAELVACYMRGELSREEEGRVEERLANDPAFAAWARPILDWADAERSKAVSADDTQRVWAKISAGMGLPIDGSPERQPAVEKYHPRWKWWTWAAAARATMALMAFTIDLLSRMKRGEIRWASHATLHGEAAVVTLADASTAAMAGGSLITIRSSLMGPGPRRLWLQGEAFFTVVHRLIAFAANSLFTVFTQDAIVTATGTKFSVRRYAEDSATLVTVMEGEVVVQGTHDSSNSLTLHAGERALVHVDSAVLVPFNPPTALAAPGAPKRP